VKIIEVPPLLSLPSGKNQVHEAGASRMVQEDRYFHCCSYAIGQLTNKLSDESRVTLFKLFFFLII
jgi:hypothetical protein